MLPVLSMALCDLIAQPFPSSALNKLSDVSTFYEVLLIFYVPSSFRVIKNINPRYCLLRYSKNCSLYFIKSQVKISKDTVTPLYVFNVGFLSNACLLYTSAIKVFTYVLRGEGG